MREAGLLVVLGVAWTACAGGSSGDVAAGVDLAAEADVVFEEVDVPPVCVPDCLGRECGPDGCGASCGECPDGLTCDSGHCIGVCPSVPFPDSCDDYPVRLGCPCALDADCAGGDCHEGFCTTTCVEEAECPAGMTCFDYIECDPVECPNKCFPAFAKLNWPCRSLGCGANGLCVGHGAEGWFCGAPCGDGKDCPAGASCAPVVVDWTGYALDQCLPVEAPCACTQEAIGAEAETVCFRENAQGTCFGSRRCTPQGLSTCSAVEPDGEHCQAPGGCGLGCREMIDVPGGPFSMGSDDPDVHPNQHPAHVVTLSSYRIRKVPVTAGEYKDCVLAGACTAAIRPSDGSPKEQAYTYLVEGKAEHPINGVTHAQAVAFCVWYGQRLPTEAEWERAARGTDGRTYPWGEDAPSCNKANYAAMGRQLKNCVGETTPVGSYPEGRSATGAFDMGGNVREWVADRYAEDAYQACAAGCTDPAGPTAGDSWVTRGGSWRDGANWLPSTWRGDWPDGGRYSIIGFRCAESTP